MKIRHRRRDDKLLGKILVERGAINEGQLDEALAVRKQRNSDTLLGKIIIELGLAKEEDVLEAVNIQYSIPYMPLDNYNINPKAVRMIPAEVARKHLLMPIDKIGASLTIAMLNPLDYELVREIESIVQCDVQTFISTSEEITRTIDKYYNPQNNDNGRLFPVIPQDNS